MCDQDNNDDERFNAMFAGGVFAAALGVAAAAALANALGAVVGAIAFTGIVAAVVTYVPITLALVRPLRRLT